MFGIFGNLKEKIQGNLYRKCIDEYKLELRSQTDPYLVWIGKTEKYSKYGKSQTPQGVDGSDGFKVAYLEDCGKNFSLEGDFVLFVSRDGVISDNAFWEIRNYFDVNSDADIVYADEDILMSTDDDTISHRIFPWTKPVWSPDTLLSFLYFGNIFAVRTSAFLDIGWLESDDYRKNIYDFVLKATERARKIGHIDKILFHRNARGTTRQELEDDEMHKTDFIGVGSEYDFIRSSAFKRRGISALQVADNRTGISYPIYETKGSPLVSIVIPSKDNYSVLKQCITSIYAHTDYDNFEIIVVDNGSGDDARAEIEKFKLEHKFTYIYEPMAFNFSKMCNIGVKASSGEYILLLNDDMEALCEGWLKRMLGQASLDHVGAVGAKLLYPNSTKLQHAGITNTVWGPGHKLKLMEDDKSYYYGHNRFVYDMIGVTAACLMVRRKVYEEVGGLYEGLAVAYNDVDFCFNLWEKGYCNVLRNDVVLYHHESLSRGDDMQDTGKLERLKGEQRELYDRHKALYRKDPYIGTILNSGEPEYCLRWLEDFEFGEDTRIKSDLVQSGRRLPSTDKMNQAIMTVTEECGKVNPSDKGYLVKGWAYVPGVDNARYSFKLLMIDGSQKIWETPVQRRYRKDVAAILQDETNVELAGFCNWIADGTLPKGSYELWLTAKDGCSRQRLYRKMEKTLVIE